MHKLKERIVVGRERGGLGGVVVTSAGAAKCGRQQPPLSIHSIAGFYTQHSARPSKGNVHGAASTGTSEKLTRLNITQLTNVPPEEPCRALLNLTRDKSQDTFKHVRGAVEPVQVYETHGSATFNAEARERVMPPSAYPTSMRPLPAASRTTQTSAVNPANGRERATQHGLQYWGEYEEDRRYDAHGRVAYRASLLNCI
ncbi:uncharacterized protein C8Q71DRAFT_879760 [Rhodofomes roseus]|uniref:Uncharacterized protein n=1 Tax=Rhodofomes roseus TaxID=34475 RepID=A0ABQ8K6F9_9APHY|nr:uncharacterized protein C8Q71DRAFT_879760 [Rhodofomes roseus]KAH9832669.1 hypothetical protein C8Q71DRAFT_879760 [Rhodofomes roseus]